MSRTGMAMMMAASNLHGMEFIENKTVAYYAGTSGPTLTIPTFTDLRDGDLLIVSVTGENANGSISMSSPWTVVASTGANDTSDVSGGIFYTIYDAASTPDPQIVFNGIVYTTISCWFVVRNAVVSSITPATGSLTNTGIPPSISITPTVPKSFVLLMGGAGTYTVTTGTATVSVSNATSISAGFDWQDLGGGYGCWNRTELLEWSGSGSVTSDSWSVSPSSTTHAAMTAACVIEPA